MPLSCRYAPLAPKPDHGAGAVRFHRQFDHRYGAQMVRVLPGDFYVTDAPDEMIVTVLGSCVAACVRNPWNGFGGLNHFLLPAGLLDEGEDDDRGLRYGDFAMEALINAVLKSGCQRQELEIKLFGGADVLGGISQVGSKNAEFAIEYLRNEGLEPVVSDLGGRSGRRIHYCPTTGKVQRLLLQRRIELEVVRDEAFYASRIANAPIEGTIELFE
ncbi:MAG: chemoreceptor glutamine deamidase CheD [Ancalomicrobiaceae bacterium]|nr:chemoreceptor glutamine deamidase CheD [Ancalomicrobiaceae bacterium]